MTVSMEMDQQSTSSKAGSQDSRNDASQQYKQPTPQLAAWRLALILVAIYLGFFVSLLDTTIVAVALTSISDEFGAFDLSAWVLTAYLLTYLSFSIIITRLSDVFGRLAIEITCLVWFAIWSMACALSKSMIQLIVFRALQGIAGSGLYSLCLTIAIECLPPKRRGIMAGMLGLFQTLSAVMGPLLGGALAHNWPWIFWINLPIVAVAVSFLLVAWPRSTSNVKKSLTAGLRSIDVLGSTLLCAACVLLVTALQTAGALQFKWNSGIIISWLTLAALCFASFLAWQIWLERRIGFIVKPVFPLGSFKHRVIAASFLTVGLSGFVYFIAVINIPERSEIVDITSPVTAGVRLLPLMCASAVGAFSCGALCSKKNRTACFMVIGAASQLLGYALMTTLPETRDPNPSRLYGFQVFLGFGFGMIICASTIQASLHIHVDVLAITQGALAQARNLGGAIGLAVATIIFNHGLRDSTEVRAVLTADQQTALYKSPLVIATLQPAQQLLVSRVFAQSFTKHMRVATYVSAACLIASLFTYSKNPPQPTEQEESYRPPGSEGIWENQVSDPPVVRSRVSPKEMPRLQSA